MCDEMMELYQGITPRQIMKKKNPLSEIGKFDV